VSAAFLVVYGGPLMLLPIAAAVAVPLLARRHFERRGRIVTAVVLVIVGVACLLASVVIVWLTDVAVNCPPEASDCL
jgi:cyanate permease